MEKNKVICVKNLVKSFDNDSGNQIIIDNLNVDIYKNDWSEKYNCMLQNSVIIFRTAQYKKFLDYVSNKYGKHFLDNCKITKNV